MTKSIPKTSPVTGQAELEQAGTYEDLVRLRNLNARLGTLAMTVSLLAALAWVFGVGGYMVRNKPEVLAVDEKGRFYRLPEMPANAAHPDAKRGQPSPAAESYSKATRASARQ